MENNILKEEKEKTATNGATTPPMHIQHSSALLKLLISQLQSAVCDNNQTMHQLTENYVAIAANIQSIAADSNTGRESLDSMQMNLNQMVQAFQGHDAFNQRLEHITNALCSIDEHLGDEALRNDNSAWEGLSQHLAESYTTTQERHIHETVTHSPGAKPAIQTCTGDDPDGGSIELF